MEGEAGELVRELLTSTVIVALITFLTQLVLRLIENRTKRKEQASERQRLADEKAAERAGDAAETAEARHNREADEFDRQQAAYSTHLGWDYARIQEQTARERQVNEERAAQGKPAIEWPPIPQPPSLRPPPKVLPPPT